MYLRGQRVFWTTCMKPLFGDARHAHNSFRVSYLKLPAHRCVVRSLFGLHVRSLSQLLWHWLLRWSGCVVQSLYLYENIHVCPENVYEAKCQLPSRLCAWHWSILKDAAIDSQMVKWSRAIRMSSVGSLSETQHCLWSWMCCRDSSSMASAKLEITGIEPNRHHYFSQKHALLCLELQHRHEIDKKKQNFIQNI